MRKLIWCLIGVTLCLRSIGQDIGWQVEITPIVAGITMKALAKIEPFTAKVEVLISGKADPVSTSATGFARYQQHQMYWEVNLSDIKTEQLSSSARAVVKQINGEKFMMLTRPEAKSNAVILPGAQSLLNQELPNLTVKQAKGQRSVETINGRACVRESFVVSLPTGGKSYNFQTWVCKESKNFPVQLEINDSGETLRIRFSEVHWGVSPSRYFSLPKSYTSYDNVEELMQWALLQKVKRQMGL